jgi:histone H3/H4
MAKLIIKNNIKDAVKEFDKEGSVTSVAEDVFSELQMKVEQILRDGIRRAKRNNRRTLQGRDL